MPKGDVHVSTRQYEWYTPPEYIRAARAVMGDIDLDPASCEEAQAVVRAGLYYDKDADGLSHAWYGRVWLNPPYCMPDVELFTGKCVRDYDAREIDQAIVLVNNATDTAWFQNLLGFPFCLLRGRIGFWGPYSKNGNTRPRQGQVIFYLGVWVDLFAHHFSRFGAVCSIIQRRQYRTVSSGSSNYVFGAGATQ